MIPKKVIYLLATSKIFVLQVTELPPVDDSAAVLLGFNLCNI